MSIEDERRDNLDRPDRHNINPANRPSHMQEVAAHVNESVPTHPLLNPESKHYDDDDEGLSFIEQFEEDHTVRQVLSWAIINVEKYMYRQNKKGQKTSDLKKIETYSKYMDVLIKLSQGGYSDMLVMRAYRKEGIIWCYKFN